MNESTRPRVLVYASGEADPEKGGSGFENLVKMSLDGTRFNYKVVGVVSNHERGGVYERAKKMHVPFFHFTKPWRPSEYHYLAQITKADFFALSGWLKLVVGLDLNTRFNSKTVFNIHPGRLPKFGGPGMFGHHVHEAVMQEFNRGRATCSAISMHFVTEPKSKNDYDRGPVFFHREVEIKTDDTADSLARRVNQYEHKYQPLMTNMVAGGSITWDGTNPQSLTFPVGYTAASFFELFPFNPTV